MLEPNIQNRVREEISYIPKGLRGGPQRRFRTFYAMEQQHDLSKDSGSLRAEGIAKATEDVRQHVDADFTPDYDHDYFT